MDVKTYVRYELGALRMIIDAAMADMTDEHFNATVPGTANPIAANFLHLVSAEDWFVSQLFQGKEILWETDGWGDKVGVDSPPGGSDSWELAEANLEQALAYHTAVRGVVDDYVDNLTDEELERNVKFMDEDKPIAEVLAFLYAHSSGHVGEIAAVKGVLGLKGLPF